MCFCVFAIKYKIKKAELDEKKMFLLFFFLRGVGGQARKKKISVKNDSF